MAKRSERKAWMVLGMACVLAPVVQAANVQFDGEGGTDFNVATNWADNNAPTADGDVHFIENGLTANLTGTATINGIVIGDASVGTLNIDGGTLNVNVTAGFPQGFSIGGHLSNFTGVGTVNIINGGTVNMTLSGGSPDTGFVGERADGTLNIGPGSTLNAPGIVWRTGQFGGFFGPPPAYEADGIMNVQGTWNTRQIYLGVQGGDAELHLSGNAVVTLTAQLHASIETFRTDRSVLVRLVGSNVTLAADDVIINSQPGEVRNQIHWVADAGGVSPIVSADALLFDNAALTVDLTAYTLTPGEEIVLFDVAPGQLANGHQFGSLTIVGKNAADFTLFLDDDATGKVSLFYLPEPASAGVVGAALVSFAMRRRGRAGV